MPPIARKKWTLTPAQRTVRALAKWMPWTFIGVILIFVYFAGANVVLLADDAKNTATLTAPELKDRVDELKWILEMIVGTAGLFTIAQGIAAGFSAKSFSDQAEGILADAKSRFEIFQLLEARRVSATGYLAGLEGSLSSSSPLHDADEGFNWQRKFYEKMLLATRENLLSVEHIFPYVVVGKTDPANVYARNLRYLAQFYWAKFVYERERGLGYLEDIERARYLLEQAEETIGTVFYLLNDKGNIQLEYYKVLKAHKKPKDPSRQLSEADQKELQDALDAARQCFEQSLQLQKKQMRAYYNLAFVARTRADDADSNSSPTKNELLQQAIRYSNQGLQFENWERKPVKDYRCLALYNLGCYYALLDPPAVEDSFQALNKAAGYGLVAPDILRTDFHEPDGDLCKLLASVPPEKRREFEGLESLLRQNFIL
jgi:hypothetical protein